MILASAMKKEKTLSAKKICCLFLTICLGLSALWLSACEGNNKAPFRESRFCLDTLVTLTLYDGGGTTLLQEAFEELERLESLLSAHKEGSDVWHINRQAGEREAVSIAPETMELLLAAKEYYILSDGYLDMTLAPLIDLWDVNGQGYVPTKEERTAALSFKGVEELELDEEAGTARLPRSGMALDLGALAKGYMADMLKAFLMEKGCTSAVLDLGHNILLIGETPGRTPFSIGVRDPEGGEGDISVVLYARDVSVVTSGTYERFFERDGVRYAHILDPYTGVPADTGVSSVTIISQNSLSGDALSTTCLLLGKERGLALIESLENVEALFLMEDGTRTMSSGFEAYLEKK